MTEMLFALGAGERIGSEDDFAITRRRPTGCPSSRRCTAVDVEKVVGHVADVVLAGGNEFTEPETIAQLRSLDIAVVVV